MSRFTTPFGFHSTATEVVEGVDLTFAHGEVVSAWAERGDSYLQAALATDAGAR